MKALALIICGTVLIVTAVIGEHYKIDEIGGIGLVGAFMVLVGALVD